MSAIEVKNLSRSYDDIDAVKDVSFTVPEKSFTVLLGPSGCGKSTILKMLSGLEQVSHGTINIGGADVSDVEASKRGLYISHISSADINSAMTDLFKS